MDNQGCVHSMYRLDCRVSKRPGFKQGNGRLETARFQYPLRLLRLPEEITSSSPLCSKHVGAFGTPPKAGAAKQAHMALGPEVLRLQHQNRYDLEPGIDFPSTTVHDSKPYIRGFLLPGHLTEVLGV